MFKKMFSLNVLSSCLLLGISLTPSLQAKAKGKAPHYELVDLGKLYFMNDNALLDYLDSRATALNNSGFVGATLQGRAITYLDGITTILPELHLPEHHPGPGEPGIERLLSNITTAVNDKNQVVGSAWSHSLHVEHAFLYEGNSIIDLNLPGEENHAFDINNLGQIVGECLNHAFLYQSGSLTDLGTLGGLEENLTSCAFSINDNGVIVGYSEVADIYLKKTRRAFVYPDFQGKMQDIPLLQGDKENVAFAINQKGWIVGASYLGDLSHAAAFMAYKDGFTVYELGVPNHFRSSVALSINNHEEVVGYAKTSTYRHAVLYSGNQWFDLNDCISPDSGWSLSEAQKINDREEIVGCGVYRDELHAFLLKPIL